MPDLGLSKTKQFTAPMRYRADETPARVVIFVEDNTDAQIFNAWFHKDAKSAKIELAFMDPTKPSAHSERLGIRENLNGYKRGCQGVIEQVRIGANDHRKQVFGLLDRDILVKQNPGTTAACPSWFTRGLESFPRASAHAPALSRQLRNLCLKCATPEAALFLCVDHQGQNEASQKGAGGPSHPQRLDSNLFILDRYEIENYLIEPDTLLHYVKNRKLDKRENDYSPEWELRFKKILYFEMLASIVLEAANIVHLSYNHRRPTGCVGMKEIHGTDNKPSYDEIVENNLTILIQEFRNRVGKELNQRLSFNPDLDSTYYEFWLKLVETLMAPSSGLTQFEEEDEHYLIAHACGKNVLKRLHKHFSLQTKALELSLAESQTAYDGPPPSLKALINVCLEQAGQPTLQ